MSLVFYRSNDACVCLFLGSISITSTCRLELVHLLSGVAKVLQSTGKLALVLGANLVAGDGLHQSRWSANKDLDVVALGLGENLLQQVLGDEAAATDPVLGGLVQGVERAEALRVSVLELVKLALQQNVLLGDVAEDEGDLGLVVGVLENGSHKLVHGGDTSATSDEGNVVVLVLRPGVLGERALDGKLLAHLEAVDVGAHGSIGVLLDQEVDEAPVILR